MPANLTRAQLAAFLPKLADAADWVSALNPALDRFEITTPPRLAAFFAQVAHESQGFARLQENLNYSAKGLMNTWPGRFRTMTMAKQFERQREKIANFVYATRLGNGDTASGDGWRYRGRGLIQLTGRGNYRDTGAAIGLPLEADPDLLLTKGPAALAAGQFWKSRGLNHLADDESNDTDDEDFVAITVAINGGKNGLVDRKEWWAKAKRVWS